jgi:hypothetical protein
LIDQRPPALAAIHDATRPEARAEPFGSAVERVALACDPEADARSVAPPTRDAKPAGSTPDLARRDGLPVLQDPAGWSRVRETCRPNIPSAAPDSYDLPGNRHLRRKPVDVARGGFRRMARPAVVLHEAVGKRPGDDAVDVPRRTPKVDVRRLPDSCQPRVLGSRWLQHAHSERRDKAESQAHVTVLAHSRHGVGGRASGLAIMCRWKS